MESVALEKETTGDSEIMASTETNSELKKSTPKARRGKKRKGEDFQPATRRSARKVKPYAKDNVEDNDSNDLHETTDPDYNLSDSDEDPDFQPGEDKGSIRSENSHYSRRGRIGRGKGRGRLGGRKVNKSSDESTEEESSKVTQSDSPTKSNTKENGKSVDDSANNNDISDSTVSSTDDANKAPPLNKLSSAYNYVSSRSRQNQAIRLPEGPNLTEEQLKQIESQFKSGDFVMAKKDTDMSEHPPIWRIDGKSLLQKFQAFDKDGKTLYRNISTYSGWTTQAKALYVPVKINFVFQSRYDTVVELLGFKDAEDDDSCLADKPSAKAAWAPKKKDFEISAELRSFLPSFEIYLQTLISQALDNNFLSEIYEENDEYFVEKVKQIDDLANPRKKKISEMVTWNEKFLESLEYWPSVNTMMTKKTVLCKACEEESASMIAQLYGEPYDHKTLKSLEATDLEKNYETCGSCSVLSELYSKVVHQKYELYTQCKTMVTNMRVSQPNKNTTNILRDLLANDEWISNLFRTLCTSLLKVDKMYEDKNKKPETEIEKSEIEKSLEKTKTSDKKTVENEADEDDPDDPEEVATEEKVPDEEAAEES